MDKRFIIFILLSIFIIYGWNFLFPQKKDFVQEPAAKSDQIEHKTEEKVIKKIDLSKNDSKDLVNVLKEEKISRISNDYITLEATNNGALIKHIYIDYLNDKKSEDIEKQIDLINEDIKNNHLAINALINEQTFDFNKLAWDIVKDKNEVIFNINPAENLLFYKKIVLKEKNRGQIILGIDNKTEQSVNISSLQMMWGPGRKVGKDQFDVKKVVALSGRKVEKFEPKKKAEAKTIMLNNGFVGMADQYFCTLFFADKEVMGSTTVYQQANQSLDFAMHLGDVALLPGKRHEYVINFYFGPQNYDLLNKLGINAQKMVDFGWFRFLSVPMYHALKYFYNITHNYGLAIILLTILIRAILWYPTHRSQTSMKKMQTAMTKMQPRLKTLKDIYKDNPQKLNEETMKLYKEYQINPMGGCLPMLLMMPVLFAMFSIMRSAVELKGAPFFWVWQDLSIKDPIYILPIAMGLSMFIQQKISTPPAATPEAATQQKMMLYLMPIMLTFFSFMWPSGLLLYWVVSNILSIGQQLIINMKKA